LKSFLLAFDIEFWKIDKGKSLYWGSKKDGTAGPAVGIGRMEGQIY